MYKYWLVNRTLPFYAPDTGGAGGGGNTSDQQQQQTQNNQQQQQQQQQQDTDEFADFWSLDDDDKTQQDKQPANNGQQQQQTDPAAQLAEHINSRIPQFDQFSAEDQDAIRQGDMAPVQKQMHKMAAGLYQNMLGDVNRMLNGMKDKIIQEAVQQSGTQINAKQAVAQMHQKLPWTADQAIAPIAQAALAQAIKKGKSVAEAIDAIPKLFNRASEKMNGRRSTNSQGFNRGNGGVSSNGNSGEDDGDGENFLELLGPGN